MKRSLCAVLFAAMAVVCLADVTFSLKFPQKEFKAGARNSSMFKPVAIGPENFVSGPDGAFAFQLSEKNVVEQITPTFLGHPNVNLGEGSFETTFKILHRTPNTSLRIMHMFCPEPNSQDLLIYYCFIDAGGHLRFILQVNNKQYNVRIPADKLKKDEFNTAKMEWNAKKMTAWINGEKAGEVELPAEFADIAVRKRRWSSLAVLPVLPKSGDAWENRAALASMIFQDGKK